MLQDPKMLPDRVLAKMKEKGVETTRRSLLSMRGMARGEGHDLPNWRRLQDKQIKAGTITRLDTPKAAIFKELWKTPRDRNEDIQKRLKKQNISVGIETIRSARKLMKKWHLDIDFKPKPKPIKLTKAQEKMIPEFKKEINLALGHIVKERSNWSWTLKNKFKEFAHGEILRLIRNYDKKQSLINTYILDRLRHLARTFVRDNLQSELGISRPEARRVIRIYREKAEAEKKGRAITDKEIAKKEGCTEEEVRQLWKAYQTYQRIRGRTGRREEQ